MTEQLQSTMNRLGALIIEARQKADLNQSKEAAELLTEAIEQCLPSVEGYLLRSLPALDALEPHLDKLTCYGSTASEYAPNAAVAEITGILRQARGNSA